MKPATSLASYLLSFLTGIMCLSVCATGQDLVVDAVPSHVTNEFSPFRALGSTVDRIEVKAADKALEQPMLNEILGAGWQVISYRQNTELQAEAWHWNTDGTWSDPVGQGYFIGQATPSAASLDHSFGYALPHRGTTMDSVEQGSTIRSSPMEIQTLIGRAIPISHNTLRGKTILSCRNG